MREQLFWTCVSQVEVPARLFFSDRSTVMRLTMRAVHQFMGKKTHKLSITVNKFLIALSTPPLVSSLLVHRRIKVKRASLPADMATSGVCERTLQLSFIGLSRKKWDYINKGQTSVSLAFWCSWLRRFWRCRRPGRCGRALRWRPQRGRGWTESERGQTSSPAGRRAAWRRRGCPACEPGSGHPWWPGWVRGRQLGRLAGWRPCWGRPELPWWLPGPWIWLSLNCEGRDRGRDGREWRLEDNTVATTLGEFTEIC